jgi:hypothetical protein
MKLINLLLQSGVIFLSITAPERVMSAENQTEDQRKIPNCHGLAQEFKQSNLQNLIKTFVEDLRNENNGMVSLQELFLQKPYYTEAVYLGVRFAQHLNPHVNANDIQQGIDLFRHVFFLDYRERFPDADLHKFDEAMSPFENYFKNMDLNKFRAMDRAQPEYTNEFKAAWSLLIQGLNG